MISIQKTLFFATSAERARNALNKCCSTAIVSLLLSTPVVHGKVYAQDTQNSQGSAALEEVIVTATKRDMPIHDVPFSVTALSGDYLLAIDAVSFTDFTRQVPGLNLSSPGRAGQKAVNIRGITPLGNGDNEFATVGFYIDDTPISDAGSIPDFALFDVNRVEVLRGPQGTLFGEGSLGGTIRIVSNKPDPAHFAGKGDASISHTRKGSMNYRFTGMLNMPIIDDELAVRLVGGYIDDGGFIDNLTTGSSDVNDSDSRYVRAALGYTPNEKLNIQASFTYQATDGGEAAHDQTNTPDLTFTRAIDGDYSDDTSLANLTIDYDFGSARFTSATSYFDRDFSRTFDDPYTAAAASALFGFTVPSVIFVDGGPTHTFTQEFRLASTHDGPLTWLLGLYYRDRDHKIEAPVTIPLVGDLLVFDLNQNLTRKHKAIFGEITYDITSKLHLTGGFRVFKEKITGNTTVFQLGLPTIVLSPKNDESDAVYKGSVSYDLSENVMTYFTYSEGFRPGGLNVRLFAPTIPATYASDSVKNYEIGAKTTWLDNRITANAAIYRIDWSDVQLADFSGGPANFTTNAGKARIDGGELEVNASLLEGLMLGANFGYADTEFKNAVISSFTGAQLTSAGEPLPFAPKTSYNLFLDYTFPLGFGNLSGYSRVDYAYVDKRRTDLGLTGTTSSIDGFGTLDLRAGVRKDNWSVTLFLTNATDKRGALNLTDPIYIGVYRNQPRTFGLSMQAYF